MSDRAEPDRPAPDFALRNQHGQLLRLSDLRGRSVLLVFFPFAFTPTCTSELGLLRDKALGDDVVVVGVSCDPSSALRAFAEQEGIDYPLLSDFWPHGEVARSYGVFLAGKGCATRGSFLVDRSGIVRWKVVGEFAHARAVEDYRAALVALAAQSSPSLAH